MTVTPIDNTDVDELRVRIDHLDAQLIEVWRERARVSTEIGSARISTGGTRLNLAREHQIIHRFQSELGPMGAKLALLALEAGRGSL